MTGTYDPAKDPAADGFTFVGATVDLTAEELSKPDWKEPLWAKFKAFCWGFGKAAALIALFLVGVVLYQYFSKEAPIASLQPPAVVAEPAKPLVKEKAKNLTKPVAKESATNNVADEALNTPARAGFDAVKPSFKKSPNDDDFTSQFDKDLSKFEAIIKKEFP